MSFQNTPIKEQKGKKYGNMMHPWLFRKEDLVRDTPSRRDGMSYEEELSKRQQGGMLIFDIVMQLSAGRGEHGLNGVAATLFNRFFKVHSFKTCDFRDVAAACLFLAGKNEDQPRKLKYVVNQLWQFKFPRNKSFPTEQHFVDQCDVVTFLEEIVLKTVAFDINIDLPHQCVLKVMQQVEKGRNKYKDMVKVAYYLATDVLLVTDWTIRYSCSAIATACVKIAAFFQNIDLNQIVPRDVADTWYRFQDPSTTLEQIDAMTKEFLDIYQRTPYLQRVGTLGKINHLGKIKIIANSPPAHVTPPYSASTSQPKKIDMGEYKGRSKASSETATRQSFMPDVKDQKVIERELAEQRREKAFKESQRQMRAQQQQQKYEEARKAEKRAHAADEAQRTKKSRLDYQMNFVAASSTFTTTTTVNGYSAQNHHNPQQQYQRQEKTEISAYAMEFGQTAITPMSSQEPPSAYQKMCMELKYQTQNPPASAEMPSRLHPQHLAPSSTQQISPPDESSPPISNYLFPPPPPPTLPRAVHTGHDELEEGELA